MSNLNTKAWLGLIFVAGAMALLLFVPAGTVHYWQAWVYLVGFFGASFLITLYLMKKDPALLKRRLSAGPTAEKEKTQKLIMFFASLGFIALLIVPALDHRFGWSRVPLNVEIFGDILVAVGFYIIFLVYKENTFTSATIEIAEDRRLFLPGHTPLYATRCTQEGYCIVWAQRLRSVPYRGPLAFVAMIPVLIWRLFDEERLVAKNLPGYVEYRAKVRWRLLPGIF